MEETSNTETAPATGSQMNPLIRKALEFYFNEDPGVAFRDGWSGIESALEESPIAALRYTVTFPTRALARVIRSVS